MMRRIVYSILVLLVCLPICSTAHADINSGLVSRVTANRYGLERAWFTQLRLTPGGRGIVDLRLHVSALTAQTIFRVISEQGPTYSFSDRNLDVFGDPLGEDGAGKAAADKVRILRIQGIQARIEQVVVPDITIYATTGNGMVHSIDAETGRTRWARPVGSVRYPTTPPAVTDTHVAVINGQTLFILSAENGQILAERRIVGGPGTGPTIVGNTAFVPKLNGHLNAFSFGPDTHPWPLTYRSNGTVLVQPTAAGAYVCWGNDKGDISVIEPGKHGVRYRLRLAESIAGPIIFVPPEQILGVTQSGVLYSFNVVKGTLQWRYVSGDRTSRPAAIVEDRVFLMTRANGVHAVSTSAGERVWPNPYGGARQFVAATTDRVYCMDSQNDMVTLDAETGNPIGRIPMSFNDHIFTNNTTDRIYIATRDGALQCFHEMGADFPTLHLVDAPDEPPAGDTGDAPADELDPAAPGGTPPDAPDRNPFESDGTNPF